MEAINANVCNMFSQLSVLFVYLQIITYIFYLYIIHCTYIIEKNYTQLFNSTCMYI